MELRNRCSDDIIHQCSLWPIIPNESWSPDFLNALALGCLAKVRPSSCHPFDMDPKTSPSPQAPRCRLQLEYTNEPIWTEKLRQYDFINMKFNTEFGYREYYIDLYGAIWHQVKIILNKQTVTRSQDYSSISILNNLNQGDGNYWVQPTPTPDPDCSKAPRRFALPRLWQNRDRLENSFNVGHTCHTSCSQKKPRKAVPSSKLQLARLILSNE